ncbi:hypothetical protein CpB1108 [Chlamydia pneumoniae TW-183]|uniref:Uncharacterized protein n=2 Tax=Chlamydia pneumoniae TaxID=83558 RepID=A0A0F7X3R4_CHLPN|nr:hypothetical protein CPn_1065 [Chlamydia pneumoniae CWL029]AAP99036.1 hypothetical protein CpB1108 [Chlamydia pneumoniae TW-183]CRI33608.1 Uncharacterized protein BN1224_Wien1_A_11150 [Chlamydia pneumoniae]BAA99272.1 hypothetical protein [Chlamydia pneumoniae J138]CRI37596.1 Uncharacterized protein BN1224_CV14_A_11150 [Chlamydia pneumoniae]
MFYFSIPEESLPPDSCRLNQMPKHEHLPSILLKKPIIDYLKITSIYEKAIFNTGLP